MKTHSKIRKISNKTHQPRIIGQFFSRPGIICRLAVVLVFGSAICSTTTVRANSLRITPTLSKIRFIYEPYDNAAVNCTHALAFPDNPFAIEVKCVDSSRRINIRSLIQFALSRYTSPSAPRTKYELIYWIDGNGATTWFKLRDGGDLMEVEASHNYPDGNSGLRMVISLDEPKN